MGFSDCVLARRSPACSESDMAGLESLRRPSLSSFQEPDLKTESTRCFSPDILRVFSDDQDVNMRTTPSEDFMPEHDASSFFPQFSRLPIELRYQIWEAALPEPTIVPRTWNTPFGYNLHRKVPEVLQACSESRRLLIAPAETMQGAPSLKYQLVRRRDRRDEGVYLNWRTDSIWIYRGCEWAFICCMSMTNTLFRRYQRY